MKISSIDPRVPLILVLTISTLAVIFRSIPWLLALTVLTFGFLIYFKIPFYKKCKNLIPLFLIFPTMTFLQSLLQPQGRILWHIHNTVLLTDKGLFMGLAIFLRMLIIVYSVFLLAALNERKLIQGLQQWGMPYEIAFMIKMALEFFPLLKEEIQDVYAALQLRGIRTEKLSIKEKVSIYSSFILPILVRIIQKTQEIALVMELRGFGIGDKRTSYYHVELSSKEKWMLKGCLVLGVISLILYFAYSYR
ncbi:energy-coupling factor transporter transmembrane protein EcfT [Clostridium ragsdalei P11]|uniref:Energy-coupling factor transporter transmembrane protein EcfT n=1 Tax=Clostridium ragsdalei P11 TaxID=1353534 RepID=A0A1A6AL00_9CLOT|nr:energy-coupling factor transporter transmembrane component T [Clostridium ragsdalei]OBR90762.1 energy-coupling factor transporter transmembrane protein EcfT [Clostridium ragsdalei P11]